MRGLKAFKDVPEVAPFVVARAILLEVSLLSKQKTSMLLRSVVARWREKRRFPSGVGIADTIMDMVSGSIKVLRFTLASRCRHRANFYPTKNFRSDGAPKQLPFGASPGSFTDK